MFTLLKWGVFHYFNAVVHKHKALRFRCHVITHSCATNSFHYCSNSTIIAKIWTELAVRVVRNAAGPIQNLRIVGFFFNFLRIENPQTLTEGKAPQQLLCAVISALCSGKTGTHGINLFWCNSVHNKSHLICRWILSETL